MSPQDYFNPKFPFPTLPENFISKDGNDFTPLQPVKATQLSSQTESAIINELRDEVVALQIECDRLTSSWVNRLVWTALYCVVSAFGAAYVTDELNASWYNARLASIKPCPPATVDTGVSCSIPRWNRIN